MNDQPDLATDETPAVLEVLTISEAADVLRISRNTAYALARQWRETGGREGLPVVELGRNLRVSKAALARLLRGEVPLPS